MRCSFWWL